MNTSGKWLTGVVLGSLLLAGCVSKVTEKTQFSGFLPNYDGLQETTSASGQPVLRWVAPGFKPASYSTVVFTQLELYPTPSPSERIDMNTLHQLQTYTSNNARAVLAQRYRVVNNRSAVPAREPALIMRAAITGVSASNEGMHWYEVIPVAAVVGAASAASGHRDQNTELYIEAELVDATTGAPQVKVVRKVFGGTLKNEQQEITANDFKAAIAGLTSDMSAFLK